jgi:hypothetical protein
VEVSSITGDSQWVTGDCSPDSAGGAQRMAARAVEARRWSPFVQPTGGLDLAKQIDASSQ